MAESLVWFKHSNVVQLFVDALIPDENNYVDINRYDTIFIFTKDWEHVH